jgi:hypothetical protein
MCYMDRLYDHYRRARRLTVARSALDGIALIFLGCSTAFWFVAFWQLLSPPALISLLSVQALVLALVYALAAPILWSALVPTTPAGQLLQKTQWRTIGFMFIVGAALYLSYQAEWMIEMWLAAQPGVAESANMPRVLAFSLTIAFILIPALAWTQLTPERWLQQIQQAHQVRRLEVQQRADLAILKAHLLWAEQKAAIGFVNLLPAEQERVVQTIRGLMIGINDQQRAIVRTLQIGAELERDLMDDDAIAGEMDYVAQSLAPDVFKLPERARTVNPRERDVADDEPPDAAEIAHVDPRSGPSIPRAARDDTRRHMTSGDDAYARAARDHFGRKPWTIKQLAAALDIGETKAREMRDTWADAGLLGEANLGRWYLTESE